MRKSISYLVTIISTVLIVFGLFSCNMDVGVKTPGNETKATGKITGKVMYSNVEGDAHNGIILTLDKTDGLVTQNVMNVMQGRVQTVDIFQNGDRNARVIVANNVTSSNGSYTFENLEAGTYTVYAASSYSSERAVCTNVVVRAAETSVADILRLTATGSITGRITTDWNSWSGNTGYLVFVAGTSYMAMTDAAGNYTISGVPAGSGYQVVASKNGVIHNLSSNVRVTANGITTLADNNFTSTELDNTVQGEKGEQGLQGEKGDNGKDGISMVWLGSYYSADDIENPQYLNAFFNMTDGCSYIFDGYNWTLLARSGSNGANGQNGRDGANGQDGRDGEKGASIRWLGEWSSYEEFRNAYYRTDEASENTYSEYNEETGEYYYYIEPQYLDAYYNASDGCSYIYANGWRLLAKAGEKGASIRWLGEWPSLEELYNAYYRTDEINDDTWYDEETGEYYSYIEPQYLDAYFNTTDGCSYIYVNKWTLLGRNGKGINWLGSYSSESLYTAYSYSEEIDEYGNPYYEYTPKYLDAYYNYDDGCSYIYTGEFNGWTLLAKKGDNGMNGQNGQDGLSMNWLGSYELAPDDAQNLDAYYNETDGCSYIYIWGRWKLLAKAGQNGLNGENGKDGVNGKDGENGKSINWRGSYLSSKDISNPQYLDAYYNTTDGCSYIFVFGEDGPYWTLLAKAGENGDKGEDGENGKSINWLGSYSSSDDLYDNYYYWNSIDPQYLDAYYDESDGCSYIFTGGNGWQLLAKAGADGLQGDNGENGKSINWLGSYNSSNSLYENYYWYYSIDPQYLDAYYNESDGCSYIFFGEGEDANWQLLAKAGADGLQGDKGDDGEDGNSMVWLGTYASADEITNPEYLNAYFNSTDGCSYIYNGTEWTLLAQKGQTGAQGLQGEEGAAGNDGTPIRWRGSYADSDSIENPQYLDAYYNTSDGCSYIYTGDDGWQLLAKAGDKGDTGDSLVWLGSYANADDIEEPQNLWAYFNTSDGCSYIYTENGWQLFARKGSDGATSSSTTGITWLGSFEDEYELPEPNPLDAYYNESTGSSYIYNGSVWILLARAGYDGADGQNGSNGTNGRDGTSINWRGSYTSSSSVYNPQYLDAYFNTTENCAYIYNRYGWTVLAKGPGTGGNSNPFVGTEEGANVVGTTLVSWDNPTGVIRIPNGVKDISPEVFRDKDNITSVIIPSSVENIGNSAFYDCDKLTSVQFLGNGLQIIGQNAFCSCDNFVSIDFPYTLTTIGAWAFKDCVKLTSMDLPYRLQRIGEAAFYNCEAITTVNIPDSIVSIEKDAYSNCIMLRTLTLGSGLTVLNHEVFNNCDSLTSVTIPSNVTFISRNAFYRCDSLLNITVSGTWTANWSSGPKNQVLTVGDINQYGYYNSDSWTRD